MTSTTVAPPAPVRWRDRLCARLGRWCELLRGTHEARIPF
jgi:hypothetical protein